MSEQHLTVDVLVIGAGNAGYSAATAAAQGGASRVLLIDKGPEGSGGNTFFTAGAYRTVFGGLDDVLPLVCNVAPDQAGKIDMEPYTAADFTADLMRVTDGRADPRMAEVLVRESRDTIGWLRSLGVQFTLSFNRQAYLVDGRQKFWGGMVLSVKNGGKGLVSDHRAAALKHGVRILHNTAATELLTTTAGAPTTAITGAQAIHTPPPTTTHPPSSPPTPLTIHATTTILTLGGFEASPQLRAQFLGPNWDRAYVRGTPHNTGDGFRMVQEVAQPVGNWSGCHSTAWDAGAPTDAGDANMTNQYTKSGYPLGIMVNSAGTRFVDEGVDFRNYTYAKFGREILSQPGGVAWQLWDQQTRPLLRVEEYGDDVLQPTSKAEAATIEELAEAIMPDPASRARLLATLRDYNAAVHAHRRENPSLEFNPAVKDGLSTQSSGMRLPLAKSNWALPVEKGPFLAVKVTCGITFTFGGIKIVPETAAVVDRNTGGPVEGLYCAGEMVGGLFWGNYPGGSGLTAGAVWGRKAGREAARRAKEAEAKRARL